MLKSRTYKNVWGAANSVWRKMYRFKCLGKKRQSQINNLSSYLKKLKKMQTKAKASRRNNIIKIKMEITEIENRKTTGKKSIKPKRVSLKRITKLTNL